MGSRESRAGLARSAREFVLIVAGVLLALWADAGWDRRAERVQELTYLNALRDNFRESRDDLLETSQDARQIQVLRALMDPGRIPADSLAAWINVGLVQISGSGTNLAVYEGFAGERLDLVSDPVLRLELGSLARDIQDLRSGNDDRWEFQTGQMVSFLVEHSALTNIRMALDPDADFPVRPFDHKRMLEATEAKNLMVFKILWNELVAQRRDRLRRGLDEILPMLDGAITGLQ
jgi:hypothetical protein